MTLTLHCQGRERFLAQASHQKFADCFMAGVSTSGVGLYAIVHLASFIIFYLKWPSTRCFRRSDGDGRKVDAATVPRLSEARDSVRRVFTLPNWFVAATNSAQRASLICAQLWNFGAGINAALYRQRLAIVPLRVVHSYVPLQGAVVPCQVCWRLVCITFRVHSFSLVHSKIALICRIGGA